MGEDRVSRTRKDLEMAGRRMAALFAAAGVAALTIVAANAAVPPGTPASAAMVLTPTDVPGAKVSGQGSLSTGDPAVASAYSRSFLFKSPYGTSRYLSLRNEVLVATSLDNAATEYRIAGHLFSSQAYQRSIAKAFISSVKIAKTVTSVTTIKPRALGFGDSALEAGSILHAKNGATINISLSLYRVGKVVVLNIAEGLGSKISAVDARAFGKLGLAHIDATLVPIRSRRPRSPVPRSRGRPSPPPTEHGATSRIRTRISGSIATRLARTALTWRVRPRRHTRSPQRTSAPPCTSR